MKGNVEWLVTRALEVIHVGLLLGALIALASVLAGCSAALTARGEELVRVEVEPRPSDLRSSSALISGPALPSVSDR